jgi:isoamylase
MSHSSDSIKHLTALHRLHPKTAPGDEIAQSHYGNNNWYGHDNEISHMHWDTADQPERAAFFRFCSELIRFRKDNPLLGRAEFLG